MKPKIKEIWRKDATIKIKTLLEVIEKINLQLLLHSLLM